MKIYFIRHGETNFNQARKFYGISDVSINSRGVQQCEWVHNKMAQNKVDQVLISTRVRTYQSAQIIFPELTAIKEDFLDEWGFGLWEGLDADEIEAKYPIEWQRWLAAPFDYTPPDAEPYKQHEERILSGFSQMTDNYLDKNVALVTHLGTIRVILHHLFRDRDFWDIQLTQGNYTCLEYDHKEFSVFNWNT